MAVTSLPLGVDIGTTRVRVAASVWTSQGAVVEAVATRDLAQGTATSGEILDPEYVGALLEEMRAELKRKERRCVLAVGEPEASLRLVTFPKMTFVELQRAASFEAARYLEYPAIQARVRVHPVGRKSQHHAVGVVRDVTVQGRLKAARSAGLRPVAIDHERLALARALPNYDVVVDIGAERTSIHTMSATASQSFAYPVGGDEITRCIERDLSIDSRSAEKRKRILGVCGAGEMSRVRFLSQLTTILQDMRSGHRELRRVALCGNGARLSGLAQDLERSLGVAAEIAVSPNISTGSYPEDVARASAPDWNLAVGLSMWGREPA